MNAPTCVRPSRLHPTSHNSRPTDATQSSSPSIIIAGDLIEAQEVKLRGKLVAGLPRISGAEFLHFILAHLGEDRHVILECFDDLLVKLTILRQLFIVALPFNELISEMSVEPVELDPADSNRATAIVATAFLSFIFTILSLFRTS